jgi:hypothetical protein
MFQVEGNVCVLTYLVDLLISVLLIKIYSYIFTSQAYLNLTKGNRKTWSIFENCWTFLIHAITRKWSILMVMVSNPIWGISFSLILLVAHTLTDFCPLHYICILWMSGLTSKVWNFFACKSIGHKHHMHLIVPGKSAIYMVARLTASS